MATTSTSSDLDNGGSEDSGYFETCKAEARDHYKGKELRALVEAQARGKAEKERLERELKKCNAYYDVLRFEMVPGRMEEMGISTINYEDIGRVGLTHDVQVSTKAGEKDALFGWLKKRKLGDLIQPVINASTLKAFIKGRIKDGKDYPTEFVHVTPMTRASITAPKAPKTGGPNNGAQH